MPSRKYPNVDQLRIGLLAEYACDEIGRVLKKKGEEGPLTEHTVNAMRSVGLLTKDTIDQLDELAPDPLFVMHTEIHCIMLERLIASPEIRALLSPDTIAQIEQHLAAGK